MEEKVVLLSNADAQRWMSIANASAKSKCPYELALNQFNGLSAKYREKIKARFAACDARRRERVPDGEKNEAWSVGVMVDAHLVAREFHIDPLTVMMCCSAPCKDDERIEVM